MIKINLQPKITLEVREGFRMPLWPVFVMAIIVAAGIGAVTYRYSIKDLELDANIKKLNFALKDFEQIIDEYNNAKSDKQYLQGKRDFVNGISQNQKQWIDFFDQVRDTIPKDVWILRLEGQRTGSYSLEGRTFTFASIGFFMLQFNSISHIGSVTLDTATTASQGSESDFDAVVKRFRLSGSMNLSLEEEEQTTGQAQRRTPGR